MPLLCKGPRVHNVGQRQLKPMANNVQLRSHVASSASVHAVGNLHWDQAPATVVGAGIAGLATAVALHRAGIPVRVLEASNSLRDEGSAIGLWDNAWRALDALGVELCRGESGRVLRGFSFSECEGGTGSEFRGVHRGALLRALADALPANTVTFGCQLDSIREQISSQQGVAASSVLLQLSGSMQSLECGLLVGADGTRSAVAQHLGLPLPGYSGYCAYRGVAELGKGGLDGIGLPRNVIRQIWGSGTRAGLYPLSDKEVYWYVTFNTEANALPPSTPEQLASEAASLVKGFEWNLEQIIAATPTSNISRSRIVDRWTVAPWGRGLITLAGDAAHPMTPNLGQGGCTALEDAVVLAAEVAAAARQPHSDAGGSVSASLPLAEALRRYEKERTARCLPLTVRANLMGQALQLGLPPVCLARDLFIGSPLFAPSHFLDHCNYDVQAVAARWLGCACIAAHTSFCDDAASCQRNQLFELLQVELRR